MIVRVLSEDIDSQLWDEIRDEVLSLSSSYRKKYPVMSADERTINAAKEVAKQYKVKYKDILKKLTPSANLSNSKSWDREGNIIKI